MILATNLFYERDFMLNSPCDGNCRLDFNTKICMGCYRTMDEILGWINFDDAKKEEIFKLVEQRKHNLNKDSVNRSA